MSIENIGQRTIVKSMKQMWMLLLVNGFMISSIVYISVVRLLSWFVEDSPNRIP